MTPPSSISHYRSRRLPTPCRRPAYNRCSLPSSWLPCHLRP
jgi:hypothetical protein